MSARSEGVERIALPDIERRLANAIRFGRVLEVDHAQARLKVKSGNIETAWLPWSGGRAQAGKRRWDAPEVGEQVVVIAPGGDLRQGFVIPGVYQQSGGNAPSADPELDLISYGDGATVSYHRGTHTLDVNLQGTRVVADRNQVVLTRGPTTITINGSSVTVETNQVTVDAPNSTFTGNVVVQGSLTYGQGMTGSGGATLQGPVAVNGGTVTHDGKNIGSSHTHSGVQTGGGNTGAPN